MDGVGLLVGGGLDVVGSQRAAEVERDAFATSTHRVPQRSAMPEEVCKAMALPDLIGVGCGSSALDKEFGGPVGAFDLEPLTVRAGGGRPVTARRPVLRRAPW